MKFSLKVLNDKILSDKIKSLHKCPDNYGLVQMLLLAESITVYIIDSRRHGQSEAVMEYHYDDFTEGISALLMPTEPNITAEMLGRIVIPITILAGSQDMMKQNHTEYIIDNIPNSKLYILLGE